MGDEVETDITLTVPTFPVCCFHIGQKEGGGRLIGNCYPYGPITSILKVCSSSVLFSELNPVLSKM